MYQEYAQYFTGVILLNPYNKYNLIDEEIGLMRKQIVQGHHAISK